MTLNTDTTPLACPSDGKAVFLPPQKELNPFQNNPENQLRLSVETGLMVPPDIFGIFVQFLPSTNRPSLARANRLINAQVIEASRLDSVFPIKNFIESLIENLDPSESGEARKLLRGVLDEFLNETNHFQKFANLYEIKQKIDHLNIEEKIISILKKLTPVTLNKLKAKIQPPDSMKDIFELSIFENRIEDANKLPTESLNRIVALESISKDLVEYRYTAKAMQVLTMFPEEGPDENFAIELLRSIVQTSQSDQAIEALIKLPVDESYKNNILNAFSIILIQAQDPGKAIDAFARISSNTQMADFVNYFVDSLIESQQLDTAIEKFKAFSIEEKKGKTFLITICIALAQSGNIEKAIDLIKNRDPKQAIDFFKKLSYELKEREIGGTDKIRNIQREMELKKASEEKKQIDLLDLM